MLAGEPDAPGRDAPAHLLRHRRQQAAAAAASRSRLATPRARSKKKKKKAPASSTRGGAGTKKKKKKHASIERKKLIKKKKNKRCLGAPRPSASPSQAQGTSEQRRRSRGELGRASRNGTVSESRRRCLSFLFVSVWPIGPRAQRGAARRSAAQRSRASVLVAVDESDEPASQAARISNGEFQISNFKFQLSSL